MHKEYQLGHIAGLRITATPMMAVGLLLWWALLTLIGVRFLALPTSVALAGGLMGGLLHYLFSELVHNLGHSIAARRTGYPMTGVRLGTFLIFATSLYPDDEPPLPGKVHIQRALGGPVMSVTVGALLALLGLLLPAGGLIYWLVRFLAIDNFLLLGLGALLPLGFTDGSTILHWWGKA